MKAIKVLMIALVAAFTVNTVSAQTSPAKIAAKTERKTKMAEKKATHKAKRAAHKAKKASNK